MLSFWHCLFAVYTRSERFDSGEYEGPRVSAKEEKMTAWKEKSEWVTPGSSPLREILKIQLSPESPQHLSLKSTAVPISNISFSLSFHPPTSVTPSLIPWPPVSPRLTHSNWLITPPAFTLYLTLQLFLLASSFTFFFSLSSPPRAAVLSLPPPVTSRPALSGWRGGLRERERKRERVRGRQLWMYYNPRRARVRGLTAF